MFRIQAIRRKFDNLPPLQKKIFFIAAAVNFIWLATAFLFRSRSLVDSLSEYQVDKLVHFGAGIFVAALLYLASGIEKRGQTLYLVFGVGVLWETFEILFLPDQLSRFRREFPWWFSDTIFDLITDVLGAYFWINLFMSRGAETVSSSLE